MKTVRIATRRSPLAIWQAEHVAKRLCSRHPGLETRLIPMTTSGDQMLSGPLVDSGGKGLFVKELQRAMLDDAADIAVHSMKDVPATFPDGLGLAVVLEAGDPGDAWVSNDYDGPQQLPAGALVGTVSLRRQSQLLNLRNDIVVKPVRGNVQTRLSKLDAGEFDAIVLASAGLRRLGLEDRIRRTLALEEMLPAAGQGVLGVEARTADTEMAALLAPLADADCSVRIAAERSFSAAMSGDCRTPVAAYAQVQGGRISLRGCVAAPDGSRILHDSIDGDNAQAARLGSELAKRMLDSGAGEILAMIKSA